MKKIVAFPLLLTIVAMISISFSYAQEITTSVPLNEKQRTLGAKFEQLETILLRMAEINAQTNPRRTALIKKVLGQSKERLIELRFGEVASTLEKKRYTDAIDAQVDLESELLALLTLLESENRDQDREKERELIKDYLKTLDGIIKEQQNLLGRTAKSDDPKSLAPDEKKIGEKVEKLSDQMSESKEVGAPSKQNKEGESKEGEPKEGQPKDGESKEGESKEGQPKDGESKEGESKEGESKEGQPKDGESKQGQPKDGESKDGESSNSQKTPKPQADQNQSPTQQAMQRAQEHIRRAEEKLERAQKAGAQEEQEEAIAELQRARAELEKILRQLREEEIMQRLQMLEARLRKMIQLEMQIRRQTEKLNVQKLEAGTDEALLRAVQLLSSRLSGDQSKVIQDAEIAILLLREDGTARAMEESLMHARFDMNEVVERLAKTDLGEQTQSVEDMIIETLQEMLEAVEQAKKDSEQRMKDMQEGNPPSGNNPEQDLVDLIAELRMIRSMQKRVYERTKYYETLIHGANPDLETLEKKTEELTRQQTKINRILHDISVGKHK